MVIRKPEGGEVNLKEFVPKAGTPPASTPGGVGVTSPVSAGGAGEFKPAGNRRSVIRIESEEEKKRRVRAEREKEEREEGEKKAKEEAARKVKEEEEKKVREEEERKRKAEEEEARKVKEAEEKKVKEAEEKKKREEEEEAERKKKEEEERVKMAKEEEERIRKQKQEEAAKVKAAAEAEAKAKADAEAKAKAEAEAEAKAKAEEEAKAKAEADAAAAAAATVTATPSTPVIPSTVKEEPEEGELVDSPSAATSDEKAKAALRIDTAPTATAASKATLGELRGKKPGRLDLTTANQKGISPSLPSALATARIIEDLGSVTYPEGILSPKPELNVNAKEKKFR